MSERAVFGKRKYRVALAGGAGTWGRYYLRAYTNHPDCEIVALVERARDRRQQFADRYGIETIYDSVEELLRHDRPDIVSAILPVGAAYDAVIACAEAGVRVVSCEKPIAAELARADEMVRVCRERGTAFACGMAHWNSPYLLDTVAWVRAGSIGNLTAAAIPTGLPIEVSGGGCVQITILRLLAGMEVEWVEGWTVPPEAANTDEDCGAYGRFGLSGGVEHPHSTQERRRTGGPPIPAIVCEVPEPPSESRAFCPGAVEGENGRVWLSPQPVLIQGAGAAAQPVHPEFLNTPPPADPFTPIIERLFRAFDAGGEAQCSGHDYRQALEVAIALKLSARHGHARISLPLADRSLKLFPIPYRMHGGDEAGWQGGGYQGPPQVV